MIVSRVGVAGKGYPPLAQEGGLRAVVALKEAFPCRPPNISGGLPSRVKAQYANDENNP